MGQHADGTYYLVQELLEGETLRQRLDRLQKLSMTETFEAILPVMDALAAAHAAGVVHRDVKPENIFLHAERRTTRAAKSVSKLIDFGVAKAGNHPVRLTAAGVVLGTPNYMAPEQVDGASDVGPQADLWSISVGLYECLAGRRPFAGPSVREVFAQITTTDPPSLASAAPTIPPELVAIIHTGLARDRSVRFSSVHAMLRALSTIDPLASAPSIAPMFQSFAAPEVPRDVSEPRGIDEPPRPAPTPRTPAPAQHSTARERPRNAKRASSHGATTAQLALGVVLGLSIAMFGAFTIRGAAQREQRAALDAGIATAPAARSSAPSDRGSIAIEPSISTAIDASIAASADVVIARTPPVRRAPRSVGSTPARRRRSPTRRARAARRARGAARRDRSPA